MNDDKAVWRKTRKQAEKLLALVRKADTGEAAFEATHVGAFAMSMFWRSRRLFEGILLLLRHGQPEEAIILGRSLFEECLRLREVQLDARRREELFVWWSRDSLRRVEGLLRLQSEVDEERDVGDGLQWVARRREEIGEFKARKGIGRVKGFLTAKDAAKRYGLLDEYWMYSWAHSAVHGDGPVWSFARRRRKADGAVGFHAKTDDPGVLAGVAYFSTKSLLVATEATYDVLGWKTLAGLEAIQRELDRIHESDLS